MRRAIFLDRDGVLNRAVIRDGKPVAPSSVEEMDLIPEAPRVVERFRQMGFMTIIVTNQPDVARGTQTREAVEKINSTLSNQVKLDAIYVCYHDDPDPYGCRKPAPGLLLQAAKDYGIDLSRSYMIGDRWRDVEAGQRAGCRTVWIDYGYRERGPSTPPDARVASLDQAARWIVKQEEQQAAREPV